jgi:hypothetical protein
MPQLKSEDHKTLVIKRANGDTVEISDLTLGDVKELLGLEGSQKEQRPQVVERQGASLTHFEPDYPAFFASLTPKGKKFVEILARASDGISAEELASRIGFKSTASIGGLAGGGLAKSAAKYGVNLSTIYVKDVLLTSDGEKMVFYKPGKAIHELVA